MNEKLRKFLKKNDEAVATYCNYDPDTDTLYTVKYTQDGRSETLKLEHYSEY